MLKKLAVISAFALCLGFAGKPALADQLSIQNASFETTNPLTFPCAGSGCGFNFGPIPGWTITGQSGSWQPSSFYYNLPLPDGNIVAYTNGGTISQTLTGIPALPNTFYTLSVFIGHRLDGFANNFSIALDAGSTTLCSFSGSNSGITSGTFADETCTFQTGSVVPTGDLSIVLTGAGAQIDFDNVTVGTPEPSSVLLTGSGLLCVMLLLACSKRKESLLA